MEGGERGIRMRMMLIETGDLLIVRLDIMGLVLCVFLWRIMEVVLNAPTHVFQ